MLFHPPGGETVPWRGNGTVALMRPPTTPETAASFVPDEDAENELWRTQIGRCLSQAAVARVLGITARAVERRAGRKELLRIVNGDGRTVYPLWQFDGRRALAGLPAALRLLSPVDDELTIASWLTTRKLTLGGRTPVDALRGGDVRAVEAAVRDYLAGAS